MSRKKGNGLKVLLALLIAALLAVVGVIVFKQYEYMESESFHGGLRGMTMPEIQPTKAPAEDEADAPAGITPLPDMVCNTMAASAVPVVEATDVPSTADVTDAPSAVDATDAPSTADVTDAPSAVDATDAPSTAEATDVPSAVDVTDVPAHAESTVWPTAEPTPLPPLESETVHALVRQMFLAAAGTTLEEEQALWKQYEEEEKLAKQMKDAAPTELPEAVENTPEPTLAEPTPVPLTKKEKIALRQEELRLNRQMTLVWLLEALTPVDEAEVTPAPSVTPTPTPVPTPTPTPDPEATPAPVVWTIEDAYAQFARTQAGREYLRMLEELGAADAEDAMAIMQKACMQWMAEIDPDKLRAINDDYACWLYCADTQIDYPVVHGEDNEYYVDHMFNRKRNSSGALFIDRRNLPNFRDPNTLIYGHNMRNDSMFGILNNYEIDGYFEVHPYFMIISEREIALVEVFAGYTTSKYDHCYDIALSDTQDMLAFVAEAQRKSDFDTTVEILPGDRLVTMSTCAYAFENARYIVIGRLNSVWKADLSR